MSATATRGAATCARASRDDDRRGARLATARWSSSRMRCVRVKASRDARKGGDAKSDERDGNVSPVFESPFADPALRRRAMRLDERLADAIALQNFEAAAAIRDEMRALRARDPLARAADELEECVVKEDYECASSAKMIIEELERDAVVDGLAPCESERATRGIRVRVKSRCVPDRSAPKDSKWFFQYVVTITNVAAKKSVKLLSRSWLITDEEGRAEAVRGAGVVGKQPLIRPGETFEYTSSTTLGTRRGTMEGFYRFIEIEPRDEARAEALAMDLSKEDDVDAFNVEIGVFGLSQSCVF